MPTISASIPRSTVNQRRLRAMAKRLVIELGYLEYCLAGDLQDAYLETAAASIDTAIDCLNEHLE
ncbi:hypothetical protein PN498_26730 [Oscillatoria sp. CS-180]|uniref:hypothetical protein n=1 Tax=Oscillatoria sp. CS-180 TaxID=3021720 RepID=UPI0023308FC4|nr:hypothetical protein [Oscillatoria sp. CS-180]MDB9529615.1 hypothetical protein [Oscillatoria sp. CS-180]